MSFINSISPDVSWNNKATISQVTIRSTLVGLIIGSFVLVSNFQFGLQTGWVSMMSLPSALLACAIFKQIWPLLFESFPPFTDVENVYIQSIAVAVGTGPLAFGFVGVIPAIEKFLTYEESGNTRIQGESFHFSQLITWSLALSFFGIFFAVPLRKQVIIKEKLPFPSGSATATLIAVLNGSDILQEISPKKLIEMRKKRLTEYGELLQEDQSLLINSNKILTNHESILSVHNNDDTICNYPSTKALVYQENIFLLIKTFTASAIYTIVSYFIPIINSLPIFGMYISEHYLWNFRPSPAYIGQGMIMGLPTVSYMMFGCILGWVILAPLAIFMEWVPPNSDPHDWEEGVHGWILWSSLSIMVVDSLVGFLVVTVKSAVAFWLIDDKFNLLNHVFDDSIESMLLEEEQFINFRQVKLQNTTIKLVSTEHDYEVDSKHLIQYTTVISGLIVSSIVCVISIVYLFGADIIPLYTMVVALVLALLLSILGVRALGETDLNPVSGIGKISQLIFALIVPKHYNGAVLLNLVAGGVAEAGAQQAGDLMQDLKTGHLLGASPKAQFIAQIIGASWSIVLSSAIYIIYNNIYNIPNEQFRVPTAVIWIDCARLVTGKWLPEKAAGCSIILGSIFAIFSLIKNCLRDRGYKWLLWIPSGVAVGVGIYNTPSFTIARFLGGITAHLWLRAHRGNFNMKTKMIVFSSGLVLGEGIFSIVNMIFTHLGVPHL